MDFANELMVTLPNGSIVADHDDIQMRCSKDGFFRAQKRHIFNHFLNGCKRQQSERKLTDFTEKGDLL